MNDLLTDTMNALAHPTRRAILERLMHGEERVTDLAAPFDMSLNAISKHIQVLEKAGLVRRRRVWREHRVSFDPGPLDEVAAWIEQRRAFWNERLAALDAVLKEAGGGTRPTDNESPRSVSTPERSRRTRGSPP